GDRAEDGRQREGHHRDARETRRKRDVGADDREEATGKDGGQSPPFEEPVRQAEMPRREADAAARAKDQRFAVASDEQVGDQRAEKVAGAGGDHDPHEGELALGRERASKRDDDLARYGD